MLHGFASKFKNALKRIMQTDPGCGDETHLGVLTVLQKAADETRVS